MKGVERALIFDFDNTIAENIDIADTNILNILRGYKNISDTKAALKIIQHATSDYKICKYFLQNADVDLAYEKIISLNKKKVQNAFYLPEIRNILKRLYLKYQLFVVSGRDRTSLEISLRKQGISSFFEEIVGDNLSFQSKPDPISLLCVLNKYHLQAKYCLYIGDTKTDYLFAKAAGCKFIGARWYQKNLTVPKNILCDNLINLESFIEKQYGNR